MGNPCTWVLYLSLLSSLFLSLTFNILTIMCLDIDGSPCFYPTESSLVFYGYLHYVFIKFWKFSSIISLNSFPVPFSLSSTSGSSIVCMWVYLLLSWIFQRPYFCCCYFPFLSLFFRLHDVFWICLQVCWFFFCLLIFTVEPC